MIKPSCENYTQDNPFRLISLREIMEAIKFHELLDVGEYLLPFRDASLLRMASSPYAGNVEKGLVRFHLDKLKTLQTYCIELELISTLDKLNRFLLRLETSTIHFSDLRDELRGIDERLHDDLARRMFLSIDHKYVPLYANWQERWEKVITAFPKVTDDAEEASKCLAVKRNTATVFHLMRIMEIGLRALGATLNDERLDPRNNPSWERILKRCREELDVPSSERSPEWRTNDPFFAEATLHLTAVKDAWRNPTMHIDRNYNEESAGEAFRSVSTFMNHLSTRISEQSLD